MKEMYSSLFTRRTALSRLGLSGLGLGVAPLALSACSSSDESSDSNALNVDVTGPETPTDVAAASEVPVGSALKTNTGEFTVMLTQPTEGEFHAFSSICTHQGCVLNVQKNILACPCHASHFSIEDGSVQGGPAPEPLPEFEVENRGGRLFVSKKA
ncbi:Rieske (2Fe-2S) protein [Rothia aerolata]|uniref:Cytochrome bc1 complex Rieske iron-sulfur subunit n=1 Tax=Rothia aerolata TaxID=1812262 RepID=A0A917IL76_9MICC|nr:Rieske (2Fe-2S) protein [Rothia aerolata]GGH56832.1 hypothetical protein GCM10007359_01350 [Rothia aerolata]